MATVDWEIKDYIQSALDEAFAADVVQSICRRLNVHRGTYWANADLGSRFYTLRRSKDVPRLLALVEQFADEALADLLLDRMDDIAVQASQSEPSRIDVRIDVTLLTGERQSILYFVPVGG